MIPILFEGTETNFITNGLGRLSDAISCKVIEERNATFELELKYPIDGIHFSDIAENRIILAKAYEGGLTQPFIIYRIEKPLDGIVTVRAEHVSYRLSSIVCMPFSAGSLAEVMTNISAYSVGTNPFTFSTDITSTSDFELTQPRDVRGILGGTSGSILDIYGGGDYEFNRFDVILHSNRGADRGVVLRYGKNITALKNDLDMTNVYTGIVPFWAGEEGSVVTLSEKVVMSSHASDYPFNIIKTVDFSGDYTEAPTEDQLRAKAQSYVENNQGWKIKNNITVSFVDLWNTEEYADIAPLERVQLCDTVHVIYSKLGVDYSTKVIKTDYNVLEERYNSITLGDTYYTFTEVFSEEIEASEARQTTHMQKAIARATKLIQGGYGGHVVFNTNADGEPEEILIMDTDDITTAVNVIRMNLNGIGFSTSGYNGTYTTAWTIDGHFVADFIDTGTLTANIIKAGVLSDQNGNTTFNLATGALKSNNLTIESTNFKLASDGKITSIASDGHVIVIDKGIITGYKTDGTTVSAQLEVGEGYFNIIGKLALNGVVGVSGQTSFVKSLTTEEYTIGSVSSKIIYEPSGVSLSGGSVSLLGCSTQSSTVSVSGNLTIDGSTKSVTGTLTIPSLNLQGTPTYTNPSATLTTTSKYVSEFTPSVLVDNNAKAVKTVAAVTGSINSADGLIQSIT